ncbi:2816_t:CDS:2, partial [Acaulospora colombiana]
GPNTHKTTLPVISVESGNASSTTHLSHTPNRLIFFRYLDHEFPDTPRVIPANTAALQASFARNTLPSLLATPIRPTLLPTIHQRLDERGASYFRETREKAFGMKLEEVSPPGDKREAHLKAVQKSFNALSDMLDMNGPSNVDWVMGSVGPTFADFAIGGILRWVRYMGDEELWSAVSAWNGG